MSDTKDLQKTLNKVIDRYYSDKYDPYVVIDFVKDRYVDRVEDGIKTVASMEDVRDFFTVVSDGLPGNFRSFNDFRITHVDSEMPSTDDTDTLNEFTLYEFTSYNINGVPFNKTEMEDVNFVLTNLDKLSISLPLSTNMLLLGLGGGVWDPDSEEHIYIELLNYRKKYMEKHGKYLSKYVPISHLYSTDVMLAMLYGIYKLKRFGIANFVYKEFKDNINSDKDVARIINFFNELKIGLGEPITELCNNSDMDKTDYYNSKVRPVVAELLNTYPNYLLEFTDAFKEHKLSDKADVTPSKVLKESIVDIYQFILPETVSVDYDYEDGKAEKDPGEVKDQEEST